MKSSSTEDPGDLLDTTVLVHINTDAVSPTAREAVTEGASVASETESAPKETSLCRSQHHFQRCLHHTEELSSTPTIGEVSSSEERDGPLGKPVRPSVEPSNAPPIAGELQFNAVNTNQKWVLSLQKSQYTIHVTCHHR